MDQCNQTAPAGWARPTPPSPPRAPRGVPSYYVDFAAGSDNAAGSVADPFRTVAHAVGVSRRSTGPRRVVLRAGIHELPDSLALGPQDNGLVIENYPQEEAWLSGAQSLGDLSWEQYHPPHVHGNLGNCTTSCLAAGHCCVGDISSYLTPSCAMGCTIAAQSASTKTCMEVCDEANHKGTFQWNNHTFNMGGSCPKGCSASDGVDECYQGCSFALGEPLLDIWQARLPDNVNVSAGFFGLHTLADEDPWHTMMTRARYPNRQLGGGFSFPFGLAYSMSLVQSWCANLTTDSCRRCWRAGHGLLKYRQKCHMGVHEMAWTNGRWPAWASTRHQCDQGDPEKCHSLPRRIRVWSRWAVWARLRWIRPTGGLHLLSTWRYARRRN